MKIELWVIGKTKFDYIKQGIALYKKRLKYYIPFEYVLLPDIKNIRKLNTTQIKDKEAQQVLNKLKPDDFYILLDERGKSFGSVEFAQYLERQFQQPHILIIFQIGGAYGFSDDLYKRANIQISLSKMTFSHQMIRLFIVEQLYRAMTILRNEPYHNE